MSDFKDAHQAGRRAVNETAKPQLFIWMAIGTAITVMIASYLHASTLQTVIAFLFWLLFTGALGYRQSKRRMRGC
jgi:FtsH-binding integral membrane protein